MKFALGILAPVLLLGEAGIIVPEGVSEPDPAKLSLEEMDVRVRIDNGLATVAVKQIFANRTPGMMEGNYTFSLPGRALISDFAVWDGVTRIPGVILERRRAEEIYAEAKAQVIDPGLLQQGERDADEARRTSVFSAHIVPIPAFGTKRVEMEYQERIPVEQLQSLFALPLRPDAYRATTVGRLRIELELVSPHAINQFEATSKVYPLTMKERAPNRIRAEFSGQARHVERGLRCPLRPRSGEAGYACSACVSRQRGRAGIFRSIGADRRYRRRHDRSGPRTIVALFDTSLSMQWEKLERSYAALEKLLRSLAAGGPISPAAVQFGSDGVLASALRDRMPSIKRWSSYARSRLRGGTDLQTALTAAVPLATPRTATSFCSRMAVRHEGLRSATRRSPAGTRARRRRGRMFSRSVMTRTSRC